MTPNLEKVPAYLHPYPSSFVLIKFKIGVIGGAFIGVPNLVFYRF